MHEFNRESKSFYLNNIKNCKMTADYKSKGIMVKYKSQFMLKNMWDLMEMGIKIQ